MFVNIYLFHYSGIYQTIPNYGESVTVSKMYREGTTYIEYKAVDDGGNVESCSFSVTIKGRCLAFNSAIFSLYNH